MALHNFWVCKKEIRVRWNMSEKKKKTRTIRYSLPFPKMVWNWLSKHMKCWMSTTLVTSQQPHSRHITKVKNLSWCFWMSGNSWSVVWSFWCLVIEQKYRITIWLTLNMWECVLPGLLWSLSGRKSIIAGHGTDIQWMRGSNGFVIMFNVAVDYILFHKDRSGEKATLSSWPRTCSAQCSCPSC